jgi:hypothetical protein
MPMRRNTYQDGHHHEEDGFDINIYLNQLWQVSQVLMCDPYTHSKNNPACLHVSDA